MEYVQQQVFKFETNIVYPEALFSKVCNLQYVLSQCPVVQSEPDSRVSTTSVTSSHVKETKQRKRKGQPERFVDSLGEYVLVYCTNKKTKTQFTGDVDVYPPIQQVFKQLRSATIGKAPLVTPPPPPKSKKST
nr:uncharacterized protein LOC109150211 [Ipomoea batatas]